MLIHLHKQATTTPRVRAAIQASDEPGPVLAERFGVTPQTIYKWRKRDSVHDRSHTPHRLQTTLTPAQEAVAVALRKTLLVSLDDLLAVVREFLNPEVSRSGLDRCLRRHGVGNLRDLQAKAARPKHGDFKAYEPGYIHIDVKYLPQMAHETSRRYLFVAIDRATRWVFIRIFKAKTAANARRFLRDLERACPIHIRTILTDNGKEFTDRLFGLRKRSATGEHEFDKLCAELGIEHRLTPPKSPQTNGMVERFNGRIEEVLQSHHFRSGEELETALHRYVWLYNQQLPQSALGSKTPLQAMKDWHKLKPELFRKQPYYLTGCDTYAPEIAKWLLLGWVFRDAPEQRLRPMVSSMPGRNTVEKQAYLLNQLRAFAGEIFPEASRWEWTAVSEVVIDRLEGSRRAIKGTLFEAIVRRNLEKIFTAQKVKLEIGKTEIRLGGETYDVSVVGSKGQILIPVKTRETMGGGHALLFTRDIHKSIAVAHESGFDCLPVIIAESWAGDLTTLSCKDHVYINMNPNQIIEVEPLLAIELERRLPAFQSIM